MRKMLLLLAALVLSLGVQQVAMAQNNTTTVTGQILDNKGNALPFISIKIKGTHTGTQTDADGNFSIQMPKGQDVLVIQASQFKTQEYKIKNPSAPIVVKMTPVTNTLGPDIHIYGQKIDPRTNTGNVTTITAKQIEKKPITNIIKALDAAPGVQLTSGGGQPGSDPQILMRGLGSLSASSAPLVVVDGVPYSGDLSSINPSDVATISLLKDATASSLYGARGSNGVILITLKKGTKSKKPQININAQSGFVSRFLPEMNVLQDPANYYKMALLMLRDFYGLQANQGLSSSQMNIYWNAVIGGRGYNNYSVDGHGAIWSSYHLLDPVSGDLLPGASLMYHEDWMSALERVGFRQQYNVSTSNGTDHSNYYFSLGYNNDQGIVRFSDYQRITARLNVDADVTSWLKTGLNTYGVFENQHYFVPQSNAYVNPFLSAQEIAPIYPVHVHDTLGNIVKDADGNPLYDLGSNPQYDQILRSFGANTNILASLQDDDRNNKNYMFRGVSFLEATFLKDFKARVDYTLEYNNLNNEVYQNMLYGDGEGSGGIINQAVSNVVNTTFRQRLVWTPSWGPFASGDNSLALTLDHESTLLDIQSYNLGRSGFTDPSFHQGDAAAVNKYSGSSINQRAIESYLAVASYDYRKKYFVKASIRRDGTSRFSPTERWGNFWSVGAGWMLSEEHFMDNTRDWLSELKLKVSYGVQGNENLGSDYYSWLPNYFFSPNATQPGYLFNSYGSLTLHWEGSFMFDAGVDFGFLNSRIHGSIDYYRKGSFDLLYLRPFAPSTGIGAIRDNVGTMLNSGVELTVNADAVRAGDFTWNVQLNLTHNKNQITKMQGDSLVLYGGGTIMKKGLSVGTFYMPHFAGVNPDNGDALYELADGTDTNDYSVASLPENERQAGTPWPVVNGALVNTFTYRNWSLSFQLNFGIGGKFFDSNYELLMQPGNALSGINWNKDILNSWTPENHDAALPRLDIGNPNIGGLSDRFLIDRSFLKIQNVNLTYTLPKRWIKGAKFRSASIFIAADNVYMFEHEKGLDVQTSFFGSNTLSYYPYRTVMFGVKLGL